MEIEQLASVSIVDIARVGGKNASIGELIRNLMPLGIQVPDGFVITTDCYRNFMVSNKLTDRIASLLNNLRPNDLEQLRRTGLSIRS